MLNKHGLIKYYRHPISSALIVFIALVVIWLYWAGTAQRIIRRHGGNIWAEAERNAATTFSFTLE